MPHPLITLLAIAGLATLAVVVTFLIYAVIRYAPIVARIFEETPLFFPLRLPAEPGGEDVAFRSADGIDLAGTYYKAQTRGRRGVIVFCHEYLSNRWSFLPYAGPFRALGFDVFTFDFRNHGDSGSDPGYKPLQWVSDHEVNDLRGALSYLKTRPDHDKAGFGLFGVSRGGSTALVVAGAEPSVWGVVTDGAFPTRGTVLSYILRWAEIYVSNQVLWKLMPLWVFRFVGWASRVHSGRRLKCRYPDVESAVARIAPRPWLMIHGEKDAYIVPSIARGLFAYAKGPKESWFVAKAKHNRCRDLAPEAYAERVSSFLGRHAPRSESVLATLPSPVAPVRLAVGPEPATVPDVDHRTKAEIRPGGTMSGLFAAQVSG